MSGPTMISCPACAGVVRMESSPRHRPVFICSVGHTFSVEELYQAKEECVVEEYEWSVIAFLKHLQMIMGLMLETPSPGLERFGVDTIRRREEQVRSQIALIEQVIHTTHMATQVSVTAEEPFPHE